MSVSPLRSISRGILGSAIAAALLLAPLTSQAVEKIKLGTVVWVGYAPFYVADKLDLYKAHGLHVDLQFFADPALIPTAIASKGVDGGMLTYDQVINTVAKGLKQKVVMPIDFSNGGDAIVTDSSVNSVAEFKGKSVAFNPLSPSDFLLAYALQKNGMTEKDIKPVSMTPEAIPGAMASGSLSIGVTYEPSISQILAMKGGKAYKVVFSSKEAPGLITDVLVFDQATIAKRKVAIKALILGYLDGLAYMKSHPDESAAIIGKVLGVSAEDAKTQMTGAYNIPLKEMSTSFTPAAATTSLDGSGAIIAKLLMENGQISAIPNFGDTYDAEFTKELSK